MHHHVETLRNGALQGSEEVLAFEGKLTFTVRNRELLVAAHAASQQGVPAYYFSVAEFTEILFGVGCEEAVGSQSLLSRKNAAEVPGIEGPACHLVFEGVDFQCVGDGSALEMIVRITRNRGAQGSESYQRPGEQRYHHDGGNGYHREAQAGESPELDTAVGLVFNQSKPEDFIPFYWISFSHIILKFAS